MSNESSNNFSSAIPPADDFAPIRGELWELAIQHNINVNKIFGSRDHSKVSDGWPRALVFALLERFQREGITDIDFHSWGAVCKSMSRYEVVLSANSTYRMDGKKKDVAEMMSHLIDTWPSPLKTVKDELLQCARIAAENIPLPK